MQVTIQVSENMLLCATYQLLRIDKDKWLKQEDVLEEVKMMLSGAHIAGGQGVQALLVNSSAELADKAKKVCLELFPEMKWQ